MPLHDLRQNEARALLQKLHRDSNGDASPEFLRLFFVDVDVLSTYINGESTNVISEWSSLFSLLPREQRPSLAQEVATRAVELANASARAISGYLLGPFRRQAEAQRHQLWLTPEHRRELVALLHAVMRQAQPAVGEWHDRILAAYSKLSDSWDSSGQFDRQFAIDRLEELAPLLAQSVQSGKVARAYEVSKRYTNTILSAPVFPPSDLARPFMLKADGDAFEREVRKVAQLALESVMERIESQQRNRLFIPALRRSLELIFDRHSPTLTMRQAVIGALGDPELEAHLNGHLQGEIKLWIEHSARIAFVQVADCFAVSRLAVLADRLNKEHPLPNSVDWRVTLISGAPKLEAMLNHLKGQGYGASLEVLHPLSVMRFDGFLRPRAKTSNDDPETSGPDYALSALANPAGSIEDLDSEKFFTSLHELLERATTAYSYHDDAGLAAIKKQLERNADHPAMLRAIGNVVSSSYYQMCQQVIHLAPKQKGLPMVSLPWVSLPLPHLARSQADQFTASLHEKQSPDMDLLSEVSNEEPTGYCLGVGIALAYIAMGKEHLQAAATAANTAFRIAQLTLSVDAKLGGSESYVPEGNEALYLSAFVSRMRVLPTLEHRRGAYEWRNTHRENLDLARKRLAAWRAANGELAERKESDTGMQSIQMVGLRYQVEDASREVFCRLIEMLVPSTSEQGVHLDAGRLWVWSGEKLVDALASACSHLNPTIVKHSRQLQFVASQLAVSCVQLLIVFKVEHELSQSANGSVNADEVLVQLRRIEALAELALQLMPESDSILLNVLRTVHRQHWPKLEHEQSRIGSRKRDVS